MINYYRTNTTKQNKNTHRNWICVQVPIWGVMSILSLQICTSEHSPLEVCTIYDFLYKKKWNGVKQTQKKMNVVLIFLHFSPIFPLLIVVWCLSVALYSVDLLRDHVGRSLDQFYSSYRTSFTDHHFSHTPTSLPTTPFLFCVYHSSAIIVV